MTQDCFYPLQMHRHSDILRLHTHPHQLTHKKGHGGAHVKKKWADERHILQSFLQREFTKYILYPLLSLPYGWKQPTTQIPLQSQLEQWSHNSVNKIFDHSEVQLCLISQICAFLYLHLSWGCLDSCFLLSIFLECSLLSGQEDIHRNIN